MRRPAEWARDSMCKVGASVGVFLPICHGTWALLGPLRWMSDLQMLSAELANAPSQRAHNCLLCRSLAFAESTLSAFLSASVECCREWQSGVLWLALRMHQACGLSKSGMLAKHNGEARIYEEACRVGVRCDVRGGCLRWHVPPYL